MYSIHAGGAPCVDWSSRWARRMLELGASLLCTLAWFGQRVALGHPLIIHENVAMFNLELLQGALEHMYAIFSQVFCFSDLGWPVRRLRRLTACVRKDLLTQICCPLEFFISSCRRTYTGPWKEYLVSSDADIDEALHWAQGARCILDTPG